MGPIELQTFEALTSMKFPAYSTFSSKQLRGERDRGAQRDTAVLASKQSVLVTLGLNGHLWGSPKYICNAFGSPTVRLQTH